MNIISNAIKFSPENSMINISGEKGELTLSDHTLQDAIQITISDQGPGVPKGEEELIFQKFMQSSTNKYSSGGTGLGLAISEKIIQAHSGKIWYEKNAPCGAQFNFLLPIDFIKVT